VKKRHYLGRIVQNKWPHRILAVNVELQQDTEHSNEFNLYDTVKQWSIVKVFENDSILQDQPSQSGTDSERFWHDMSRLLVARKTVLVVMPSAYRAITALGFWGLLESGDWCIIQDDIGGCGQAADRSRKCWHGTCITDNPPTIISCRSRDKRGNCTIIDPGNWGIKFAVPGHATDKGCNQLHKAIVNAINFLKKHNLGSLQSTASGQAMRAYRTKYHYSPILVHDDTKATRLERESLHSGRCESFTIGRAPCRLFHYDSSSHYAGVSYRNNIPTRLIGVDTGTVGSIKSSLHSGIGCIADVTLSAWTQAYPHKNGLDVIYPIGKFRTTLCGPELEIALAAGDIQDVHLIARYEMSQPFNQYYSDLFQYRLDAKRAGDVYLEQLIKAMLSRFHGKFAQYSWRWQNVQSLEWADAFNQWWQRDDNNSAVQDETSSEQKENGSNNQGIDRLYVKWRSIGYSVQVEKQDGEHRNSCCGIASYIQSLGRVRLWTWIMACGKHNVHYVDTDSIWCNDEGSQRLIDAGHVQPDTMGKLTLKGIHDKVIFHGLKTYTVDDVPTRAGIPDDATVSDDGVLEYYVQENLISALKRASQPGRIKRFVRAKMPSRYRHGHVQTNGRVEPLIMPQDKREF
jgi:hypothetical protein